jgi:hypothetical protein
MVDASPPERRAALLDSCTASAAVQVIVLVAVLIALPILFYAVVRASDADREAGRVRMASEHALMIAKGLAPSLERATPAEADQLGRELARFAAEGMTLKLFFRPPPSAASPGIFFIAAGAPMSADELRVATERLQNTGVFQRLVDLCEDGDARATVAAADTLPTIVTRVRGAYGCWGILTDAPASAAAPLWSNPALRLTGLVYAALAVLALGSVLRLMLNLRRLRAIETAPAAASTLRTRIEPTFAIEPALASEPPPSPPREDHGTDASAQPEPDHAQAEFLNAVRGPVDLSQVVRTYVESERRKREGGPERLAADIADGIVIHGRADFVDTILSELIGNALGGDGKAHVSLAAGDDTLPRRAFLTVAYDRAASAPPESVWRLSLIKQFVAALGAVSACENRDDGGQTVRVAFQAP